MPFLKAKNNGTWVPVGWTEQIQADYAQTDETQVNFIKNKPEIDDVLSSTSTNSVQNKVVTSAMSELENLIGDSSVSDQISTAMATKADINHTHTEYALVDHTHENLGSTDQYALADHTHSEYALVNHTHTDYALASDVTDLSELVGDISVSTQISAAIATKVDAVDGKELSSNDYTDDEKSKLADIEVGANKTVVDSALSSESTNPVQNQIVTSALATLATNLSNQIDSAVIALEDVVDDKADANHTHNYAGSSSAGGAANKVANAITVKLNSGTTEEIDMFTFDGSVAKTMDITASAIGAVTMDCSNMSETTSANEIIVSEDEPDVVNGAIWINPTSTVDTGWQEVTLNTADFKVYNDIASNTPIYRKIGNVVQIKGIVSPTSDTAINSLQTSTATEIGAIPVECAPSTLTEYTVCHGSGGTIWLLDVTLDGSIRASRYAMGDTSNTPAANVWMPFSITYLI